MLQLCLLMTGAGVGIFLFGLWAHSKTAYDQERESVIYLLIGLFLILCAAVVLLTAILTRV